MTSPVQKKIREMSIDELPDSLLIHILSFLGVRRAGVTVAITKRWEGLWAELPCLEFENEYEQGRLDADDYVSWINRTIEIRKTKELEKFRVCFIYREGFAPDVDAWVEFCVKNKVKQLSLEIKPSSWNDYYRPPQVMYSCSSFTTLYLRGCRLDYQGRRADDQWKCLTDLTLDNVVLSQKTLDEILSSCPVLKNLELTACRGFSRLDVKSHCLYSLAIEESEREPIVEISAPYIRTFEINKLVLRGRNSLLLRNISSVVTASIDLLDFDGDNSVEMREDVKDFLESFRHVKDLHIRNQLFQVLSKLMAVNDWQFRWVQHLKIEYSCREYQLSISGIICLLESSPNVETLFLNGFQTEEEEGEEISDLHHPAAKSDFDGELLHLKKITVFDYSKDSNAEPLLLTLASILLRRTPVLEDMVIVLHCQPELLDTIREAVHSYPRSSEKLVIKVSTRVGCVDR